MARYAVKDAATGRKENVIEWDGVAPLALPGKVLEPDDGTPIYPAVSVAAIKEECQRRIFARYPQTKQANMQARDNELIRIQQGLMVDGAGNAIAARALTEAERAEQIATKAAWDWIKATREASNALEASLPDDFPADRHWPT